MLKKTFNVFFNEAAGKKRLGAEIATRSSDPHFYGVLQFLPNPDTILRKLGKSQDVFDAIIQDAHVIGELRPMRANVITKKWRILPGGDKPEDRRVFELAQKIFNRPPVPATGSSPGMGWPDVFWNMQEAVLRGQRIHEVVWESADGLLVPVRLVDRPNHRFVYGPDNRLRLLTRDNRTAGVPVDNYKFLVARHMPSFDNPYGVALLSSCFWPWTFKHNGFRFFTKFCEKYGIPWAVGKYPAGTAQPQIEELADGLARMVEDAIAAIPDNGTVQLIEAGWGAGRQLPQERLIQACNAEISKCLNSQTLATEINGQGSRAAAETHRGREQDNGAADRKVIESNINQLLAWMAELNFVRAAAPSFQFYDDAEVRKDWLEVFDEARNFMNIPTKFAYERLQIPMPMRGETVVPINAGSLKQSDFAQSPFKHLEQWIEIFKSGSTKDSHGNDHLFTVKDLDEVVANFELNDPPPYVIGHPENNAPVFGRVQAIKRDGLSLWVKGTQIDPQFNVLVAKGFYRNRSVRIIQTAKGWQLVHVGFLGATPPAVQGLRAIGR